MTKSELITEVTIMKNKAAERAIEFEGKNDIAQHRAEARVAAFTEVLELLKELKELDANKIWQDALLTCRQDLKKVVEGIVPDREVKCYMSALTAPCPPIKVSWLV